MCVTIIRIIFIHLSWLLKSSIRIGLAFSYLPLVFTIRFGRDELQAPSHMGLYFGNMYQNVVCTYVSVCVTLHVSVSVYLTASICSKHGGF